MASPVSEPAAFSCTSFGVEAEPFDFTFVGSELLAALNYTIGCASSIITFDL